MFVPSLTVDNRGFYKAAENNVFVKAALLIPVLNAEGLMTALHTKPDKETNAKYMWMSINKSFKIPPHNKIPLFCCWYDWSPGKTVALVEGGLKACVFSA